MLSSMKAKFILKHLLHEKFIYLNVNKNQYSYGIGLVHEAMWGGSSSELGDFQFFQ